MESLIEQRQVICVTDRGVPDMDRGTGPIEELAKNSRWLDRLTAKVRDT